MFVSKTIRMGSIFRTIEKKRKKRKPREKKYKNVNEIFPLKTCGDEKKLNAQRRD